MNLKLRTITTRNNLTIVMLRQSNVVQLASNWLWWRMRLKPGTSSFPSGVSRIRGSDRNQA